VDHKQPDLYRLWLLPALKLCKHQPSASDRSMTWYCIPCKYHKNVKQEMGRTRHLENYLKARAEICSLKAGNVSSNFMQHDNSGD
jgi:hypothetical protein